MSDEKRVFDLNLSSKDAKENTVNAKPIVGDRPLKPYLPGP